MIRRIARIVSVFIAYRLDLALPRKRLPVWLRVLLAPLWLLPRPKVSAAVSARLALEALGPIFVKFGQALSTRQDLFDEATWTELKKLQDEVAPFSGKEAVRLIHQAVGEDLAKVLDVAEEPLASASVAQVHTAKLHTAEGVQEVVVKIIRPGVEKTIRADLSLMYLVARLLKRFVKEAERLHPVELVKDYDRTIMGELNLLLEADNTAKLRENWLGSGKLYVPKVYHEFSRTNVMVMERVYGVTATNLDALRARGVNLKKLAHLGVEIFFTQVFDHNFFHADMHPGNVFVDTSDPENPTYIALDCAIIGTLTESDQRYLARNLLAFFHRDYDEVARLHIQSGWVPPDTDEREFAAVITAVCDPIFQKPIKDISFGLLLVSLFQTARQFNMEVQPQLVLLQKTLINIEGMGRQIYPDLNLWETAEPFMDNWMKQRVGLTSLLNRIMERAPAWLEQLPEAPDFLLEALQEAGRLGEHRRRQEQTLQQVQAALQGQAKRHRYERLGGAALVAGLLSLLAPATGLASPTEALLPGALLGSLGVYWLYIHS